VSVRGGDTIRKRVVSRSAVPTAVSLPWLTAWYDVLRSLPSAHMVRCSVTLDPPPETDDAGTIYGTYDERYQTIAVCALPNPYEVLGTLMHEMAHAMGNQRHRRHHGYSWRRAFSRLTEELVGIDPLPVAEEMRDFGTDQGVRHAGRQAALDWAVIHLLTEQRVRLVMVTAREAAAVAGGRVIHVHR
jgi:hypothetical protein